MDEKLISGYTAYTTADEYGAAATGEAPASTSPATITIFTPVSGLTGGVTIIEHC
ncbi:LxmA leader domain family RiPP [Streptomyces sp. NPDC048506]|uniref:LxmA leader domain family RiPP n=1 Tax=Streptomyces sp. NPDC048506 TaxID=3155028 RepID=UPI00341C8A6C